MGRAHEVRAASMAKTAAAKSKLNNKWSRQIYMAAKGGVPDPDLNQTLKNTIARARKEQVTADVIKRAIDKAKGADQTSYTDLVVEGFGPGQSQFVICCLTDNHNRTQTAVKIALQKCGGKVASSGSVSYQFDHLAIFSFKGLGEEDAVMALLDAGCDPKDTYTETDEETGEDIVTIEADYSEYSKIRTCLTDLKADLDFVTDTISWVAQNKVDLNGDKEKEQFERLLSLLEEDDDVQDVYYNVNYEYVEE
jgi:YebC/PmpR family DNA-binding regulatory protein